MRDLIYWTETSYTNAGQSAWSCRDRSDRVLFYLVGRDGNWHVRNSLGRGYVAGDWAARDTVKFQASGVERAKHAALFWLTRALRAEAETLRQRADYLNDAARVAGPTPQQQEVSDA